MPTPLRRMSWDVLLVPDNPPLKAGDIMFDCDRCTTSIRVVRLDDDGTPLGEYYLDADSNIVCRDCVVELAKGAGVIQE